VRQIPVDDDLKLQTLLNRQIVQIIAHRHGVSARRVLRRAKRLGLRVDLASTMSLSQAEEHFVGGTLPSSERKGCLMTLLLAAIVGVSIALVAWASGVLDNHVLRGP
jgi:hypothetical protein